MKEAAGEANLTVIVIVLIGIIVAVATPMIQNVLANVQKQSCCQSAGGTWSKGKCKNGGTAYDECIAK